MNKTKENKKDSILYLYYSLLDKFFDPAMAADLIYNKFHDFNDMKSIVKYMKKTNQLN